MYIIMDRSNELNKAKKKRRKEKKKNLAKFYSRFVC